MAKQGGVPRKNAVEISRKVKLLAPLPSRATWEISRAAQAALNRAKSEPEKREIMDKSQCKGCGIVAVIHLHGPLCGTCERKAVQAPDLFAQLDDLVDYLTERTLEKEKEATALRRIPAADTPQGAIPYVKPLPHGPNLMKAGDVAKKLQTKRREEAWQAIACHVAILLSRVTAKKPAELPGLFPIGDTAKPVEVAKVFLQGILKQAEKNYDDWVWKVNNTDPKPSFEWGNVTWGVKHGHKSTHSATQSAPLAARISKYKSAFRPAALSLTFQDFKFKRCWLQVAKDGTLKLVGFTEERDIETISVIVGWKKYLEKDEKGIGGYLGQGYSKNVFLGQYNDKLVGVAQLKAAYDNGDNVRDLLSELKLLKMAQYFMDSFYAHVNENAPHLKKQMPNMKWNLDGAFVGILEKGQELNISDDSIMSLLYTAFLVTPVLPKGKIIRFTGAFDVGDNTDKVGKWVDKYTHYVVIDSQYSLCITDIEGCITHSKELIVLFDPQGDIAQKITSFWDTGKNGIKHFLKSHQCNEICEALDFDPSLPSDLESQDGTSEEGDKPVAADTWAPSSPSPPAVANNFRTASSPPAPAKNTHAPPNPPNQDSSSQGVHRSPRFAHKLPSVNEILFESPSNLPTQVAKRKDLTQYKLN
ncbi:hypothetical protein M422DRAFT_246037 [Sphaerobolus stellatus SS14]|nr:hypothetical protein M422DRAFT_246037 [Sphaerobolus stellatus SS14]